MMKVQIVIKEHAFLILKLSIISEQDQILNTHFFQKSIIFNLKLIRNKIK